MLPYLDPLPPEVLAIDPNAPLSPEQIAAFAPDLILAVSAFQVTDRATYDRTIDTLHSAMAHAKVDRSDKLDALKRLGQFAKSTEPEAEGTA